MRTGLLLPVIAMTLAMAVPAKAETAPLPATSFDRIQPFFELETAIPVPIARPAAAAARALAAGAERLVTVAGVAIPAGGAEATPQIVRAARRLSCVPFARALSGIDIRGNAATWWAKAKGIYAKLTAPVPGAVMVFAGQRRMRRGHVAVVKDIVSSREVRVDHANWGNDGRIYLNAPVVDVSKNNDWSAVKVWNTRLGVLGTHVYRLKGFVAE